MLRRIGIDLAAYQFQGLSTAMYTIVRCQRLRFSWMKYRTSVFISQRYLC
ncbi:MAG: hypothetical protein H6556_29645 [Lewinellaceae bacterium]|nr:hypothetical protein [Lewinellaceae bacterium]